MVAFGGLLRRRRLAAGMTQEALAERSGLSERAIRGMERGEGHSPRRDTIDLLAHALGISGEERVLFEQAARRSFATVSGTLESSFYGDLVTSGLAEPATSLVGRERLVAEAAALLRRPEVRLLTITGTAGVGKTRVGLRVAGELRPEHADGAIFVGLAPVVEPERVVSTVARALGLRETGSRPVFDRMLDHLRDKELLLVLDNFEQVRAAGTLLAHMVSVCPRLKILVTSRVALRVRGEQQLVVPPLDAPAPAAPDTGAIASFPAVALFVERAQAADPAFSLTDENAEAVTEVCHRLDGLPLAIELAASRANLLPPEALLARLAPALGLLAGGGPDLPDRQRTMRATLDWSRGLLSEEQQTLFRCLSAFAGGFTLESAEAVCAGSGISNDILGGLHALVDANLLRREVQPDGDVRLDMLAVVREYARELLAASGEAAAVRERHAGHFLRLVETAFPALFVSGHTEWAARLEREHDNLREALRWARETGNLEAGMRMVGALSWFWWTRGYLDEGRRWAEDFVSEGPAGDRCVPGDVRARALNGAGQLALGQGELARAAELFERSLALYRELEDAAWTANVLAELGQVVRALGDCGRAAALSEEALSLSRRSGEMPDRAGPTPGEGGEIPLARRPDTLARLGRPDAQPSFRQRAFRAAAALAHNTLGHVERRRGNDEAGTSHHEKGLALFRGIGNERGSAYSLSNLASASLERGQLERALALSEESLALYRKLGDRAGEALALINLGDVARAQGDEGRAAALYRNALVLYRELGNERGAARMLERLAAKR
jgi:predicted ATPase/DNA-binding XRE family transcriptional regulator